MKKISFNVFGKVKHIFGCGFFLLFISFFYIVDKQKSSMILFVSLFAMLLIFFLHSIFEKNYYCGNEITDTPDFFKKRTRNFSQIFIIEKGY